MITWRRTRRICKRSEHALLGVSEGGLRSRPQRAEPAAGRAGRRRQAQPEAAASLIGLWKGAFAAVLKEADPVLGPWRVFAALPQNEFAARAKDLQRDLAKPKDPNAAPVHPLVARAVLGSPPANKGEVVADTWRVLPNSRRD